MDKNKNRNKNVLAKRYVVQRNELLYGRTTVFNVTDLKIFKLIISKVNSKNLLFDDLYEISNEELKELNINEKHLYQTTLASLKKLANVYMTIENEKDTIKEVGLIQNNFVFKKYSNKFYISFHQDMKDYLLDIQEKYTKYPLADIKDLKLKHSIKFYEYIKSLSFDEVEISIEKLKKRLDIPDSSYEKYSILKMKVIDPVIDEINEKTSLTVSYEPVKDGRKISKLKFFINKKINIVIEKEEVKDETVETLNGYINKEFVYDGIEYKILKIDFAGNFAEIVSLGSNDIGKLKAENRESLLEKLEIMINAN